ncbi:MAG: hypothetical protein SWZ49_11515 [Cyanobacteriota bacterium]|nr:hypothetical protein [Cyanobacteriota bacterium]
MNVFLQPKREKNGSNIQKLFMTSVTRFEFPLAKGEYLLTYRTASRVGGDKQNFWRYEMGFESAEAIRESILAEVSPSMLKPDRQNNFGNLYRAYIQNYRTIRIITTNPHCA